MEEVMSPEEFKKKMQKIADYADGNPSYAHEDADALMMEVLESLGYEEGVQIFNHMYKWYA